MSKKSKKSVEERIQELGLPEMYIVFYNNVDGIEFFDEPHGSKDRLARNVNVVSFFNSEDELKTFYTQVTLSTLNQEAGEQISINQRFYYCLVERIHDTLTQKIDIDNLSNEIDKDPEKAFKRILDQLPFYRDLNDDLFEVMKEHHPEKYDIYSDNKYIQYTPEQMKLLLYSFNQMNTLFALYTVAMNPDHNAELYICKLTPEQLLHLWEVYTVDFQGAMSEEDEKNDYPMYHTWRNLEYSFYQKIEKRKKSFDVFLKDLMKNSNKIDKTDFTGLLDGSGIKGDEEV